MMFRKVKMKARLDFMQESTVKAVLLELGICVIRKVRDNKLLKHDKV